MIKRSLTGVLLLACGSAATAQQTPYYITNGDASTMWIVQNGALQATVGTYSLAYPLAVRNTVWVGHRDDAGAAEYDLAGNPTGNTSAGGGAFSQLLDGAAGNGVNYGIECCGGPNSVTVGNTDWSGQGVQFDINYNGSGVAYDSQLGSIWTCSFDGGTIREHDLAGNVISQFSHQYGGGLSGLAYEAVTDSLWAYQRNSGLIIQFSKAGSELQSISVQGLNVGNAYGGEMVVPAPGALALLGLGGLTAARRRR